MHSLQEKMKGVLEFVARLGNARHKNLIKLLGFCYNKHMGYLLYDYLRNGNLFEKMKIKRDWAAKCRIVIGIGRGLCFLYHDCCPAIPHGDLKASNVAFDENMEPHLAESGFKFLVKWNQIPFPTTSRIEAGDQYNTAMKDELYMDIYNFGEIILEVLTNGRLASARGSIQDKPMDGLLREICRENGVDLSPNPFQEEIKLVLEVALLSTRNKQCDRPSMEDVLKLLSGLKLPAK